MTPRSSWYSLPASTCSVARGSRSRLRTFCDFANVQDHSSSSRTTNQRGMRCAKPSLPCVAQMTVRSSSRNARTSSGVILICSRRLTGGTVVSPARDPPTDLLVSEDVDRLAALELLRLVAVRADLVGTSPAVDRRGRTSRRDVDEVDTGAAEDAVAAEPCVDRVVARARGQVVLARAADEMVLAGRAVDAVVAEATGHCVATGATLDAVVATTPVELVVAAEADDPVGDVRAGDAIGLVRADDGELRIAATAQAGRSSVQPASHVERHDLAAARTRERRADDD